MLYSPTIVRRAVFNQALNSPYNNPIASQFLHPAAPVVSTPVFDIAQDETAYTFSFDVPGISREHLTIGIEGNVVRLESTQQAKRQYIASYELPQDIDVSASEAKLENGVLTLKLAKLVPVNKVTQLPIH
jgi:HSP20 family protein